MCGRYQLKTDAQRLREQFTADPDCELTPNYNVAPSHSVAVVREIPEQKARILSKMRWGLVPHWAKDLAIGYKMINARSETVLEKPGFREAFKHRRCLIPADGFYEWKKEGKAKQPFHFGMADDSVFAFAGIWEQWKSPEGKYIESCSILTTTPNKLVEDVHDRMPVILPRRHYGTWLTAPATEAKNLADLLVPYEPDQMRRFAVSPLVNSVKNNSPECCLPQMAK